MFKILMLHTIYDSCIEVFFENIQKSFSIKESLYKIGDCYDVIIIPYNGTRNLVQLLWHCRIESVYEQYVSISYADFNDNERDILHHVDVSVYDIEIPKDSLVEDYRELESNN